MLHTWLKMAQNCSSTKYRLQIDRKNLIRILKGCVRCQFNITKLRRSWVRTQFEIVNKKQKHVKMHTKVSQSTSKMLQNRFCSSQTNQKLKFENWTLIKGSYGPLTCNDCFCHLDNKIHPRICQPEMIGNGQCQDNCNTDYFQFDGEDCCQDFIDDLHCIKCICQFDNTRHLPSCAPRNLGTGFCTGEHW